jgi:hypothetical protein
MLGFFSILRLDMFLPMGVGEASEQGVTKRCRLSRTCIYTSPNAGGWGAAGTKPEPVSKAVHITWHGAQINFGDLTPYLTYASDLVDLVCLGHDHAVPLDNHSIRVDAALK